jgi:hypothetical protein
MTGRPETTNELDKALFAVRGDLTPILKDSKNPFFKSDYAGLPTTIRTLDPIFRKHGILVLQGSTQSYTDGSAAVVLNITTELVHVESGEFRINTLTLPLKSQDPQQLGSAVTYGRRYLWQLVAGAEVADDDGNANTFPDRKPPAEAGPPAGKYSGPTAQESSSSKGVTSPSSGILGQNKTSSPTRGKGSPSSKAGPTTTSKGSKRKSKIFGKSKTAPKAELPEAVDVGNTVFDFTPKD